MTIYVTKAYDLRQFLPFVQETVCQVNISHHLQYLEFLYKIKQLHDPKLTTFSLLNKSIIVEYFTVIEAILDDLLCQIEVIAADGTRKPLSFSEYTRADELFKLAKEYGIVDDTTHSRLGQLKSTRNKIHVKRYHPKRKYEHEEYSQELLEQHEAVFRDFMTFLLQRHCPEKKDSFPWPCKARP